MTVTIIGPTPETEQQREVNASGKFRIFNGLAWVHDYDTKAEAKKFAKLFGGTAVGQAFHNGKANAYREVEKV